MPSRTLRYDDANMRESHAGTYGVNDSEWKNMTARLRSAKKAVQKMSRKNEQGFMHLPSDRKLHEETLRVAKRLPKSFTDLIVLGIGGSDLGARALYTALAAERRKKGKTLNVHFSGSSTDPDVLTDLIGSLNLKKTCVNVISKSGGTLETMSAFLVFRDLLRKRVGKKFAKHIIATTDPEEGALLELAKKEAYELLRVPMNVGGRFSVLSPVGLLPAAAMGIDTHALLASARLYVDHFHEANVNECGATRYAGLHVIGMEKRKQHIHVLMAYARKFSEFTLWVRQLIAESLGKEKTRSGKTVHTGPTPIASMGPEDQHSQLQLYSDGPFDKLITFLGVKTFEHNLRTPDANDIGGTIARFGNRSFSNLIQIERRATSEALAKKGRPNGTIEVQRVDERTMGELFMFFEIATALMGELMDINAFNQPGVELSKQLMKRSLR